MAIAGLVCSLCVPLITLLLVPVGNMPSTDDTAGVFLGVLFLAGAILWISGLVLSLLARSKADRRRRMATAGIIVSVTSPLLLVVLLIVILLQAVDWYFNDFFTMGVPNPE